MQINIQKTCVALALLTLSTLNSQLTTARAQGTAFTYQGRLISGGSPASGTYNLQFSLFNVASGGSAIAGPVTNNAMSVTNGLFTTAVDFGNIFTGGSNWLQIAVSTNGGNAFSTLAPRQQLTPTPYSIFAESAGGLPGLVVQPNSSGAPNLIGGSSANVVSSGVIGATISGGGTTNYFGTAYTNSVTANFGAVGGGIGNTAANGATVAGGEINFADGITAAIGGGIQNLVNGNSGTVAGGYGNTAGNFAVVGGGFFNLANNYEATVAGGYVNNAAGLYSFIGGGSNNVIQSAATAAVIAGGAGNAVGGLYATVGGGLGNTASGAGAFVGGGGYDPIYRPNTASGIASVVSGGSGNLAGGGNATVGGGFVNTATNYDSTVSGGADNTAGGNYGTVGGGLFNKASLDCATVGGGDFDSATNFYATVPGGFDNVAGGQYSFAAGYGAQAVHDDSFVWADGEFGTGGYFSDRPREFKIQAGGGVQMDVSGSSGLHPAALFVNSTSANGVGLWVTQNSSDATAVFTADGTGDIIKGFSGSTGGNLVFEVVNNGTVYSKGVALTSDRNAKENFAAVSPAEILARVAGLPISQWNYKTDPADQKHLGPMAQDFQAAFGLNGGDDKHISVVDEGGVALAAIQGLNEKVENGKQQAETQLQELKTENAELKMRLEKLERLINARSGSGR